MKCSLTAVVIAGLVICGNIGAPIQAAIPVVWDGSAGIVGTYHAPAGFSRWEEGNWTRDGGTPGQTARAALTTVLGVEQDGHVGGRGGLDIVIGGGAKVFHDQNDDSDDISQGGTGLGLGDFKPRMDHHGPGSLTIKEGAELWLDSHTDVDGRWARMDINVNLDNGTLRTSHTPAFCPPSECSTTAGRIIFGYNNDLLANTILNWNITNGGKIEMEGKMTWGNPNFWETPNDNPQTGHNPGIGMHMTINDGTLDLTGGNLYDDFFGLLNGELIFVYETIGPAGTPKNESYIINFTGPGQIITDTGPFIADQGTDGVFGPDSSVGDLYTPITYQRLWERGILRANGQSGLTGANFNTYFSVTGAPDDPNNSIDNSNYTLTSLLAPPGLDGDHNEDGLVDAADYVAGRKIPGAFGGDPAWFDDFRTNFGEGGPGGGAAVPEPMSLAPFVIGLVCLVSSRRNRRRLS